VRKLGGALAILLVSLAVPAGAGAWTKLTPDSLQNIVDPAVAVLAGGGELIAYREPNAGRLKVIVGGKTKTLASGLASVGDPQVLQLPDGSLTLYAAEASGVVSYASSDGGATWAGPTKIASTTLGDVQAAALRKNGTPLFSQDGTEFVNVYQGAGGETMHNLFPHCCGYAESLAVDAKGVAQIAFWSNATGRTGFLYGKLSAAGALAGSLRTLSKGATIPRDNRVPLVADGRGDTFVGISNGYPTSTSFVVDTLRNGATAHSVMLAKGTFSGPQPLMALATDPAGRLWAVWTQGGSLWAAQSRSAGAHFGAAVEAALPGSDYQLEAAARQDGSVDAILNTGSALRSQQLLPGLTVVATATGVRVLDDGFPVAGATIVAAGKSVKTGAAGTASLGKVAPHTPISVHAAGYTPATARSA
jgi:hypothetical protein